MVVSLNHLKSSGIRHGISLPFPMTRFSLIAAIALQVWLLDMDISRTQVLNGNRRLDTGIGIVVYQFKVVESEVPDIFDIRIDTHGGQFSGIAFKLELGLIQMILI